MQLLKLSRWQILLLNLTVLVILTISYPLWDTSNKTPNAHKATLDSAASWTHVSKVIDGDTFITDSGQSVRLIGIDAPEMNYKKGEPECKALEAKLKLQELVKNKSVKLVKDKSDTDKYGRLLRYVYLKDGTFINAELVRLGLAKVKYYKPDTAKHSELKAIEAGARKARAGLFSCANQITESRLPKP